MQCTLAGNVAFSYTPIGLEVFDQDEIDDDTNYSYDRTQNLGGLSVDSGEGAYLDIILTAGIPYTLVVGASDGEGPYEVTIKAAPLQ